MKVDRSNPRHWAQLILFGINVAVVIALRPLLRLTQGRRQRKTVVLYGHKLTGNLLAIYRELLRDNRYEFHPVFLTMDPSYYRTLQSRGENTALAIAPRTILLLATADAVISDHGVHSMAPLTRYSSLRFFDVWHGIPFKGFDADDFRVQLHYDETWVASPLMRDIYISHFGFEPEQVVVTGYARTDALVTQPESRSQLLQRLRLAEYTEERLVMFAPTWQQDDPNRTPFPFNADPDAFLNDLAATCHKNGARLLFRTHLNDRTQADFARHGIIAIPFADEPDTEALLQVTDVLICDWSSIAFDFLVLKRPTIFLDTSPPFAKGLSLGAEYRFGPVADSPNGLLDLLTLALRNPQSFHASYDNRARATRNAVYGGYADGQATKRCIARLRAPGPRTGFSRLRRS